MGVSERKEREREARQTAILDAAEVIFRDKGFTAATMEDIARTAELAKGTVYLYYRSKEELQLGLAKRGLELMLGYFESGMEGVDSSMERLLTLGGSYRRFAEERFFYFELLHFADKQFRPTSAEAASVEPVLESRNAIWKLIVGQLEQAKRDGMVRNEVNSAAVALLLWTSSTSVLRTLFRMKILSGCPWFGKQDEFQMGSMDWTSLYRLNGSMLWHAIVTDAGASYLAPLDWSLAPPLSNCCSLTQHKLDSLHAVLRTEPFVAYHETGI